jgi:OFA family oxalate/formate antiporter-like MFS transporter
MSDKALKIQAPLSVAAAIAIQLTLGIAYIWSVFQTGIAGSLFGGNEAQAGLTFSLLLATLTIGSVIGGKLAAKWSIRVVVLAGGVILSLGFLLAGFVTAGAPWLLWLTYGVMGGVGMGFTYSTTIACAQKWYPHKKGLVTGVIVSALGFGGVIFSPVVELLIGAFGGVGVGEQGAFMVLAAIFLVVCTTGSFFLKNPPEQCAPASDKPCAVDDCCVKNFTATEMLKTPQFYLVLFTFMAACMGGLMMINFAKQIATGKGVAENVAVIGVMIVAMFNSLGRLIWGIVSDKLGRQNTIIVLLSGGAVLSLCVMFASKEWIFVLIAAIGFFYGGLLSNFPSLTADLFGPKNVATNYGLVLLGFGAGAIIASQIAGHYRNLARDDINLMFPAFVIASCAAAAGIVMMLVLRFISKKNH